MTSTLPGLFSQALKKYQKKKGIEYWFFLMILHIEKKVLMSTSKVFRYPDYLNKEYSNLQSLLYIEKEIKLLICTYVKLVYLFVCESFKGSLIPCFYYVGEIHYFLILLYHLAFRFYFLHLLFSVFFFYPSTVD
jgi:hypothetical protein